MLKSTPHPAPEEHIQRVRRIAILLLATILISLMVVSMNRLVWRRLYYLAETKYKLLA